MRRSRSPPSTMRPGPLLLVVVQAATAAAVAQNDMPLANGHCRVARPGIEIRNQPHIEIRHQPHIEIRHQPLTAHNVVVLKSDDSDDVQLPPHTDTDGGPGDAYSPFGIDQTIYDEVLRKLKQRHDGITGLGSDPAKWIKRQAETREALSQLFSPLPPENRTRTPRFIDRGSTAGSNFTVRRLLIETRPGYYASAGLFMPVANESKSASRPPLPAVLFPSGHSTLTWREPGNQLIAANLVRRGIAVLGYDPIGQGERRMLPDLDGRGGSALNGTEGFGCSMEHEYVQRVSTLNGVNAASQWVWDMIVLIDFLESQSEIDSTRLGVAGCSGGGVQSAYIGAIDERLTAASIACYTSTLTVDYAPSTGLPFTGGGGPAEGEQQWGPWVGTGAKLDKPDLLTVRAPRPTQVLLTTRDQYFPLVGGEAAVSEAMPAFKALAKAGVPDLTVTVGNNTHGYINKTRMALYRFFSKHLLHDSNDSGSELPPDSFLPFWQMRVTSTGNVITAPELNDGTGSTTVHQAFVLPITLENLARLDVKRQDPAGFLREVKASVVDVVGFQLDSTLVPNVTRVSDGVDGNRRYAVDGEGRCKVGLEVMPPTAPIPNAAGVQKAVMYVSRKGQSLFRPRQGLLSNTEQQRIHALQAAGFAVILVDICGFGSFADKSGDAFGLFEVPSRAYRTKESHPVDAMYNLGRSVVGLHAADVVRSALVANSTMEMQVVATVAANETAAAVLAAALISPLTTGDVALISNVAAWSEIALSPRYDMSAYYSFVFGGLRHFDLPDVVAALNSSVFIAQPLDGERRPLNLTRANDVFRFAKKQTGSGSLELQPAVTSDAITNRLLHWLVSRK